MISVLAFLCVKLEVEVKERMNRGCGVCACVGPTNRREMDLVFRHEKLSNENVVRANQINIWPFHRPYPYPTQIGHQIRTPLDASSSTMIHPPGIRYRSQWLGV